MNNRLQNNECIENIPKANWLNIIPDLNDKDVLKVGTERIDNIMAIVYFNPKSVSCIGSPSMKTKAFSIHCYESFDDVPKKVYDLIIFDEPLRLASFKSLLRVKELFIRISQILRDDGILLLCFPNDLVLTLKYRYWIKRILPSIRFNSSKFYFCKPSVEQPKIIFPYFRKTKWLIDSVPNINESPFNIRHKIKNILKRITKIYNPFWGLILVTGKSVHGTISNETLLKITETAPLHEKNNGSNNKEFLIAFTAKAVKQNVLFYNPLEGNLRFIAKIGFPACSKMGNVKEEYENLLLLSDCETLLDEQNINIPAPLEFLSLEQKEIASQSAVRGERYALKIRKLMHKKNQKAVLKTIEELIDVQIYIQRICTSRIIKPVRWIKKYYLDNYLGIPLGWQRDDMSLVSDHIQHGDFTLVNIYRDFYTNKWGIIDWEWMAKGYPPLFDFFSIITSIRFINDKEAAGNAIDRDHISFIHTYFCKNWFSDHLNNLAAFYCDYFKFDKRHIFGYFTAFLLLQCNKYKLIRKSHPYLIRYEKMIQYSIKNKNSFVLT